MKKIIACFTLLVTLFCGLAYAADNETSTDNSTKDCELVNCEPNEAFVADDGTTVVLMGPTIVHRGRFVSRWQQIVLGISATGQVIVLFAEP